MSDQTPRFEVHDLGRMGYRAAYDEQQRTHERVLAGRDEADAPAGVLLVVEHDPVITVTRRPEAASHVIAPPELLESAGVERCATDRGGDVTYHGPGQIVVYPIVDLNRLKLRLHAYLRTLEDAVMGVCAGYGLAAVRDACATGAWIEPSSEGPHAELAKICAIGVRVRKWVTLHGLALNVTTDLDHFKLIVPCGLHGRPVTSLSEQLGKSCPPIETVRTDLVAALQRGLADPVAEEPAPSRSCPTESEKP